METKVKCLGNTILELFQSRLLVGCEIELFYSFDSSSITAGNLRAAIKLGVFFISVQRESLNLVHDEY